jgi:RND superfamily putative drug exporter
MGARLPIFFAAVLILSFLLLLTVFHSLVVPIKAVVMNMLSIGASFGLMVAVFQWGIGGELIGLGKGGPIEAWAPMMLFAIVFGLSMDYEVFLLTRVREEYDRTGDNGRAVADGLAATGRVISAAAAIMVCVFGSFILGDERALKLMGFGLASAILIDATIVRLVLVPSAMELMGKANWWAPSWLVRYLPTIRVDSVERERVPAAMGD